MIKCECGHKFEPVIEAKHRLLCGDSTKAEDVARLMDGAKADMVFSDPPYGYSYESNHQDAHKMLQNDNVILGYLPVTCRSLAENAPVYVCCSWQTVSEWLQEVRGAGLTLKNIIVWKKNNWSMGDLKGAYAGQHEMILFAHKGRVELAAGRDRDVWEFDREPPTDHPTKKPVDLICRAIKNHAIQSIYDPFCGSGSAMVAAQNLSRKCYALEISPNYCAVILERMSTAFPDLTIKKA